MLLCFREKDGLEPPNKNHTSQRTGKRSDIDVVNYLGLKSMRDNLEVRGREMVKDSKAPFAKLISDFLLQDEYKYLCEGNHDR